MWLDITFPVYLALLPSSAADQSRHPQDPPQKRRAKMSPSHNQHPTGGHQHAEARFATALGHDGVNNLLIDVENHTDKEIARRQSLWLMTCLATDLERTIDKTLEFEQARKKCPCLCSLPEQTRDSITIQSCNKLP